MKALFILGRLLFGGYFIYNGINHFLHAKQMADSKNVPQPELAVSATGAALVLGGTSILLGIKPRLGAAALVGFLAGGSPIMHDFCRQDDPNKRMEDMIQVTKNMALLGGTLAFMAVEAPWPASVPVAQPSKLERIRKVVRREVCA